MFPIPKQKFDSSKLFFFPSSILFCHLFVQLNDDIVTAEPSPATFLII